MFAGEETAKVLEHLNSIGNAMNIEMHAHQTRNTPTVIEDPGPGFILLKDGDEIDFGQGPEGEKLGNGPLPLLCNLHLAVARAILMSDAADTVTQWMDEADDSDCPHVYLASDPFFKILTAKLHLGT
ncbi:hypothetical protein K439DRAFT_1622503 [Ramaria rubella]|nr:hypothetical protein K439DRAFT_1622503 [Ramaria rubella]